MSPFAPPVDGQAWLNCDPIDWESLRGRAVLVVFWSFACEASLLRLRQVEQIVADAGPDVVGIAVHTPRFPFEEERDAVTSAVAEHQLSLPVVHDPEFLTWNLYNPAGWPATVVVDAEGRALGTQAGTDSPEVLADSLALARAEATSSGPADVLDDIVGAPQTLPSEGLAFPRSVTTRANGEVVVADSANGRVLIFEAGADPRRMTAIAEIDGFDYPTGLAADGEDGIYLCEPALGRVSLLDLKTRSRRLLADNLVSPTSVAIDIDDSIVVADTGAEKLYRLVLSGSHAVTMGLIAGSGRTGTDEGNAGDAALAQPMGLARTEVGIVFCDAASSNVRMLTDAGKVATITGNGLYDWGLVDGPAHEALLQRPSGLAVLDDGSLIIVDTGNNRLRRLARRRIRTLGLAGLDRPGGLCVLPSGQLVVADTGNHRLVLVDSDLQQAWPISLSGVLPPRRADAMSDA